MEAMHAQVQAVTMQVNALTRETDILSRDRTDIYRLVREHEARLDASATSIDSLRSQ